MLAIAVELEREVEPLTIGEAQPGLDGAADTKVAAQPQDARTTCVGHLRRAVDRAIVDDDHLHVIDALGRLHGLELDEQTFERLLLVEGRDDDQQAHACARYTAKRFGIARIVRIARSRSIPIVRQYQSSEAQRGRFSSSTMRRASSRFIVPLRT